MAQTRRSSRTTRPDEIDAKLKEHGLDDWYLEDDWIRRKYNTDGWPTTLMVVNAVGFRVRGGLPPRRPLGDLGQAVGQAAQPCRGGITDKDFAVARKIEDTVLWRPEEGSALEGTPNKFVFSKGGR